MEQVQIKPMSELKSLKSAFAILGLYTADNAEYSVSQITHQLDMNRSTVLRIVSTLVSANMLSKSALDKKYRLGSNIIKLAKVFLSHVDLTAIAMPYMKELQNITKETILLHLIDGDQRICIAGLEGTYDVRRVFSLGARNVLHAGAPGKALLSFLPDSRINEYIMKTGLPKYTENTITDKKQLLREVEDIRSKGFATSYEEITKLSYGIAAPIRNYLGEVIAAISVSGVIMRISPESERQYASLVKKMASIISEDLGYVPQVTRNAK
jgi:IclR family transcriptional regulator, KDG regulon repressor